MSIGILGRRAGSDERKGGHLVDADIGLWATRRHRGRVPQSVAVPIAQQGANTNGVCAFCDGGAAGAVGGEN
jgi:hypothetical protein